MGKREEVKKPKSARDFYATIDPDAVIPLLPYIDGKTYAEPCYGKGDLVRLLGDSAKCLWKSDIHWQKGVNYQRDATTIDLDTFLGIDLIITNPPFSRSVLLPMLDHLVHSGKPVWLLLPADIMHNKYMSHYMDRCDLVLSVGRLCWFPVDNKIVKGVDNYCWYRFGQRVVSTTFEGRVT